MARASVPSQALMLTAALVIAPQVAAQTYMTVTEESTGRTQVITEAEGYGFNLGASDKGIGISTIYRAETPPTQPFLSYTWYAYVDAPHGETLRPGFYPEAGCRSPKYGRSIGIEVTEDNPVCSSEPVNDIYGWMALRQFELDENGALEKLEMVLTQRLGSPDNPGLAVVVRHNTTPMYFRLQKEQGPPRSRLIGDFHGDSSFFEPAGRADDTISYAASVPLDHWLTLISPPTGRSLSAGRYRVARHADAQRAGLVLLKQLSDYLTCSSLQGSLDVRDIAVTTAGEVTGLWAQYRVGCTPRPTLTGEIRYGL